MVPLGGLILPYQKAVQVLWSARQCEPRLSLLLYVESFLSRSGHGTALVFLVRPVCAALAQRLLNARKGAPLNRFTVLKQVCLNLLA